ncbi:MAG: antitoxin VbhA family protein [Oscillospiraceae bacterium]|nr:antitoxin VbhA family protein [Oscillospiraceae bacterium]
MTAKQINRRIAAVKTADAINAIEGVPVSRYARVLSYAWARGELTGEQMKAALLTFHQKLATQLNRRS